MTFMSSQQCYHRAPTHMIALRFISVLLISISTTHAARVSCISPDLYRKDMGTVGSTTLYVTTFDAEINNQLDHQLTGIELDLTFKNSFGKTLVRHTLQLDSTVDAQSQKQVSWQPNIFTAQPNQLMQLHQIAAADSKNIVCKVTKYVLDTGKVIKQK